MKSLMILARGSSPHARGAHECAPVEVDLHGIIPACAGSTDPYITHQSQSWDHPRMRGEHRGPALLGRGLAGSSPHARGAPSMAADKLGELGIIPACAGSTSPASTSCCSRWDHPRMRGEHYEMKRSAGESMGSSPHARGALRARDEHVGVVGIIPACAGSTAVSSPAPAPGGIIPACAGSTASRARCWSPPGDHPRMRGEHFSVSPFANALAGSSPHARGAQHQRALGDREHGIIPACAGSTAPRGAVEQGARDHPRMRGEHPTTLASVGRIMGSSPHARGAPGLRAADVRTAGIIPACAGSTWTRRPGCSARRDHPRMRGEHQ